MHRLLLTLTLTVLVAFACRPGTSGPEPSPTSTQAKATSTPTTAELDRLLIQIRLPCEELTLIPGLFETLREGPGSFDADDLRDGVVSKYRLQCSRPPSGDSDLDSAFPDSMVITLSAFESATAALQTIRLVQGQDARIQVTASADPFLGDKSVAMTVSEGSSFGEFIEFSMENITVSVVTMGATDQELSRFVAEQVAVTLSARASGQR